MNKAHLIILEGNVRMVKKRRRKWNKKHFAFLFISPKAWTREQKKGKSITRHTWILFPAPFLRSFLKKPKLLSKLIACCGKTGIKENNQGVRINLGQPPYLLLAPLLFSDELLLSVLPHCAIPHCFLSLAPWAVAQDLFSLLKKTFSCEEQRRDEGKQ